MEVFYKADNAPSMMIDDSICTKPKNQLIFLPQDCVINEKSRAMAGLIFKTRVIT